MVQIKIKKIEDKYHVFCIFSDFPKFISELKKRLDFLTVRKTQDFEAFFHIPDLSVNEYHEFFTLCNHSRVYIMGINWWQQERTIYFVEQKFRGGEEYYFDNAVILCSDIAKDVRISCASNVYIMGCVQGTIDLLHQNCEVYATLFQDARVRICDSDFQNVTSFARGKVYYEHGTVVYEIQKEEEVWQKQSQ